MPLLDVCEEIEAQEEIRAKADESSHLCDVCKHQTGSSWLGHLWVCALCRWLTLAELMQEPNS